MPTGYDVWGAVAGVLGIIGLIPLLLGILKAQLPSAQLKKLDEVMAETSSLFHTACEEGLLKDTAFVAQTKLTLVLLYNRTEGLRADTLCANTFRKEVIQWLKGLSCKIAILREEVQTTRVYISVTSAEERQRLLNESGVESSTNIVVAYDTRRNVLFPSHTTEGNGDYLHRCLHHGTPHSIQAASGLKLSPRASACRAAPQPFSWSNLRLLTYHPPTNPCCPTSCDSVTVTSPAMSPDFVSNGDFHQLDNNTPNTDHMSALDVVARTVQSSTPSHAQSPDNIVSDRNTSLLRDSTTISITQTLRSTERNLSVSDGDRLRSQYYKMRHLFSPLLRSRRVHLRQRIRKSLHRLEQNFPNTPQRLASLSPDDYDDNWVDDEAWQDQSQRSNDQWPFDQSYENAHARANGARKYRPSRSTKRSKLLKRLSTSARDVYPLIRRLHDNKPCSHTPRT